MRLERLAARMRSKLSALIGAETSSSLLKDDSGVSVIELSLVLPPMLYMGMFGMELVNLATVNMQVSQIALSLSDNASRLGQTDNSGVTPTINETDIDSVMAGAIEQGISLNLAQNGKIILTSFEYDEWTDRQYIHWQRCRGDYDRDSDFGDDGVNNGLLGVPKTGIGSGTEVSVTPNTAVMFVEVYYDYDHLFGDLFIGERILAHEAAYLIRDDRNLEPGVTGTRSSDDTCAT